MLFSTERTGAMGNVIITGGDLKNKGAQAMTFITVDEIRRRFPEEVIYLAAGTGTAEDSAKAAPFQFEIIDAAICDLKGLACVNRFMRLLLEMRYGKKVYHEAYRQLWQDTDLLIDISGYSIGTDWGVSTSLLAALRGRIASLFGAKVYYMPQSFGPCDFAGLKGKCAEILLKKWLSCADILFAREKQGYDLLADRYGLTNVRLSCDLVLQNRKIDLSNVYKEIPDMLQCEVKPRSMAVIPNAKTLRFGREEKLISLYQTIINRMLDREYYVYLIYHSSEDRKICGRLKDFFAAEERVIWIQDELSCIAYGQLVKQFDFVIASRYHSIVHAYKEGVPCIVLGWAVKYTELLSLFGQEKFVFDVRGDIDETGFWAMIAEMEKNCKVYSEQVKQKLEEIQSENVFDAVEIRK